MLVWISFEVFVSEFLYSCTEFSWDVCSVRGNVSLSDDELRTFQWCLSDYILIVNLFAVLLLCKCVSDSVKNLILYLFYLLRVLLFFAEGIEYFSICSNSSFFVSEQLFVVVLFQKLFRVFRIHYFHEVFLLTRWGYHIVTVNVIAFLAELLLPGLVFFRVRDGVSVRGHGIIFCLLWLMWKPFRVILITLMNCTAVIVISCSRHSVVLNWLLQCWLFQCSSVCLFL